MCIYLPLFLSLRSFAFSLFLLLIVHYTCVLDECEWNIPYQMILHGYYDYSQIMCYVKCAKRFTWQIRVNLYDAWTTTTIRSGHSDRAFEIFDSVRACEMEIILLHFQRNVYECECVLQFNFESRALRYVRAAISLVNTEFIHCTISCHGIICIPFLFSGKTSFLICCIDSAQNSAHRSLYKWNFLHIDQLFLK